MCTVVECASLEELNEWKRMITYSIVKAQNDYDASRGAKLLSSARSLSRGNSVNSVVKIEATPSR